MAISTKDIFRLTGAQKVAIVLLSMADENATKLMSSMNDEEIKEISHAMSRLGAVSPEVVEKVLAQLHTDLTENAAFLGNLHNTEKLLGRILEKDRVESLMDELRGPQGRNTWEKLGNVSEDILSLYLRNEHPQTAALVLSKLSHEQAANVLGLLPDAFAFEVITRMLNISSVNNDVLTKIEQILRLEFISTIGKSQEYDSFARIAEIFNSLDRNSESKYMSMLETNLPDIAKAIKDLMFTFDDLIKIDQRGIQRLLRDIDKSRLILALKGAKKEVQNIILSSMSQRAAKIITDEMENLGPVRVKDVDSARGEIVTIAKTLISNGEIDVVADKDEFIA